MELIDKPGDARGRMPHNGCRDAGFLDDAVLRERRADPTNIDVEGADRPATENDSAESRVVGYGIDDRAGNLRAIVDDLKGRYDELGRPNSS